MNRLKAEQKFVCLCAGGKRVKVANAGEDLEIILDKTPFYAEGGGQVGDVGELLGAELKIKIEDTRKPVTQFHISKGKIISGRCAEGDYVQAKVAEEVGFEIRINHTITHVLHATLQEVLGSHIKQAGSLVTPDYLRFRFFAFWSR